MLDGSIYNTSGKRFNVVSCVLADSGLVSFRYIEIDNHNLPVMNGLNGYFTLSQEEARYDSNVFEKLLGVIGR